MKKILSIIKRKEIDVIILLTILVAGCSLFVLIDANDELWNFANSYKMFNGYKIYKDLNVIITPMFFYIAQIFFKVFGANMLSFRIYNIVISTTFFMLIYLIFKSLKIVRRRAIFYTTIIIYIFSSMVTAGANYNLLTLIPILIAIILIIKQKQNPVLLGILLCTTFLIKQNVYIFFALGIFIYRIMDKDKINIKLSDLFKTYIISIIGILLFLIYLYIDGNLYNFLDYCFLGISEFGTNNIAFSFNDARYLYIDIIAIIFTMFIITNKKTRGSLNNENINNLRILLSLGIPLLLISYPIINYYHSTLASIVIIIEIIYIVENILIKNLEIKRKKEKKAYIIFILFLIIYLYNGIAIAIAGINKGETVLNNKGAYYGSITKKEDYENIGIVCNYIKEQEKKGFNVKILSYKANLYMINLNKNNKKFDLAFVGNLGKDGEEGLIDEIEKMDNTLILINTNPDEVFWQESKKVMDYIISNYKQVDEVKEYSAFYIN